MIARSHLIWLSMLLLASSLACATERTQPSPETAAPDRGPYVIGAGDVLRVHVWKNEELTVDAVVRTDGKISVPLLSDVQAEGLTPQELRDVVSTSLEEYITAPEVTVAVVEPQSKRVFVIGEVVRSGTYPLLHDLRVIDAITLAGGFGPFADKDAVKVIRKLGDGGEGGVPLRLRRVRPWSRSGHQPPAPARRHRRGAGLR